MQQSAGGLGSSARSSMSLKSCGRSSTHTLSSLSTAKPRDASHLPLVRQGFGPVRIELVLWRGLASALLAPRKKPTSRSRPTNECPAPYTPIGVHQPPPHNVLCDPGLAIPTARSLVLVIVRVNQSTRSFSEKTHPRSVITSSFRVPSRRAPFSVTKTVSPN